MSLREDDSTSASSLARLRKFIDFKY